MRKSTLTMTVIGALENIDDIVAGDVDSLTNELMINEPEQSNNYNKEIVHALISREIITAIANAYVKRTDELKKQIDELLQGTGTDINPVPGLTVEMYAYDNLRFSKRQNKNSTTVGTTSLINELHKLGVEASTIKKALEAATTERKGNVYYETTLS